MRKYEVQELRSGHYRVAIFSIFLFGICKRLIGYLDLKHPQFYWREGSGFYEHCLTDSKGHATEAAGKRTLRK